MYDPVAERYKHALTPTLEETLRGCDAIVLMVGHDAFKDIDPRAVAQVCRGKVLIDTRAFFPSEVTPEDPKLRRAIADALKEP